MTEQPMQDADDDLAGSGVEDVEETAAESADRPAEEFVDAEPVDDDGFADEQALDDPADGTPPDDTDAASPATGHPAVDEVLRSLDALGEAPVDEHVAVFEQAHEQLRRTLQGAGDEQD